MKPHKFCIACASLLGFALTATWASTDPMLIAHYKLAGDARDHSGNGLNATNHGADLTAIGPSGKPGTAARFDGRSAYLEVPDHPALGLGTGNFSISVWVHTEKDLDDTLGDIAGKYDPATRTGFNFSIANYAGVTSHQPNYRNVHFGIDAGRIEPAWTDCGRPGNALYVMSLCVYDGQLYAGTFETGKDEAGHVYRYEGGSRWTDCGSPDRANSVQSLAVFDGRLYAGTARYRAQGSALPPSPNENPGGHVYRYEGPGRWSDCGRLGDAAEAHALAVFGGKLYAIPLYSQGMFRYDGGTTWTYCGTPGYRLMALAPYNGRLYAAGNERAGVLRYEGDTRWAQVSALLGVTQTYSFATYEGQMHVGTWPNGAVFRYDGGSNFTDVGRLGSEQEVMGMAVYNGKLYAGTLPLAQVYRYDGPGSWTLTGRLDHTPDVRYRRAWSMAVFQGKLFCGTLPSGHVYSLEAGTSATYDRELSPGWHHLAAVRDSDRLRLYVDGRLVATSSALSAGDYDLSHTKPLRIGFGQHDYFNGSISDLGLYGRALSPSQVMALYNQR